MCHPARETDVAALAGRSSRTPSPRVRTRQVCSTDSLTYSHGDTAKRRHLSAQVRKVDYSVQNDSHCVGTTADCGKWRLKRWVFGRLPKTISGGSVVTFCGRSMVMGVWDNEQLWWSRRYMATGLDVRQTGGIRSRVTTKLTTVIWSGRTNNWHNTPPSKKEFSISARA